MLLLRRRAYARAGLLGNPSDGYHGRTISIIVRNYFAEAVLYEWEDVELILTDERLYRDPPPCGLDEAHRYLVPAVPALCPERTRESRSMLGQTQHQWFVDKLTTFIGHNLGVLTGGGGGVMRLATDKARHKGALTGACFLELGYQS